MSVVRAENPSCVSIRNSVSSRPWVSTLDWRVAAHHAAAKTVPQMPTTAAAGSQVVVGLSFVSCFAISLFIGRLLHHVRCGEQAHNPLEEVQLEGGVGRDVENPKYHREERDEELTGEECEECGLHTLQVDETACVTVGRVADDEGEKNAESGSCIEFYRGLA